MCDASRFGYTPYIVYDFFLKKKCIDRLGYCNSGS